MNKHDYKERPNIDDVWNLFDYRVLMGGMGDDTAMLIAELYVRGYEPDEIVFCDTGSEFPHTYKFIEHLRNWMELKNWSKLTILKKFDRFDKPLSVISLCKSQSTLPAAAFGAKSCSLRFKAETADKYSNNNHECWKAWGIYGEDKNPIGNYGVHEGDYLIKPKKTTGRLSDHTGKILRMVGINYDEPERAARWSPENKWVQSFPLFDWGIGELESDNVEKVGLYYPGKSSCYICPHLTHGELAMLRDNYPELLKEGLEIERNYRESNLVKSNQEDLFGDVSYENSTVGLGGLKGKTWGQMLKEYDDNPLKYKSMTNNKPCECGD